MCDRTAPSAPCGRCAAAAAAIVACAVRRRAARQCDESRHSLTNRQSRLQPECGVQCRPLRQSTTATVRRAPCDPVEDSGESDSVSDSVTLSLSDRFTGTSPNFTASGASRPRGGHATTARSAAVLIITSKGNPRRAHRPCAQVSW